MERLINPKPRKEDASLKINIVRHGPSSYKQPEWHDIQTADDLNALGRYEDGSKTPVEIAEGKAKAMRPVRESAEAIAAEIGPDEEVVIWASPTGRTLETAKIIRDLLAEKGIQVRRKGRAKEHGVSTFDVLGEVKHFSWNLFEPLMNGGEVNFKGAKFIVDKALSNPRGLGYPDYFTSDALHDLPREVKDQWPSEYVQEIERFESFASVTQRMTRTLRRLKSISDKHYRIILVTHDALTGSLVKTFTSNQLSGVNPGQFLSLERKGDALVVTRAGSVLEGDGETGVA